jgi:hypothetical protein
LTGASTSGAGIAGMDVVVIEDSSTTEYPRGALLSFPSTPLYVR